jgi:hypothetical protein
MPSAITTPFFPRLWRRAFRGDIGLYQIGILVSFGWCEDLHHYTR